MDGDIYDWIDITAINSEYEIHHSPSTGRYRHRPISLHRLMGDGDERFGLMSGATDWKPGLPPR